MRERRPIRQIMISSTTRDLPAHRAEAMDACLRQGFQPRMMEHLATDRCSGLERSLKMVDECDIYLLIVGVRYGEVPAGSAMSITEAEYERAVARRIPLLTFIADEKHQFSRIEVETGPGAEKLERFRQRLRSDHVVEFFKSADELGKRIVNAISQYRTGDTSASFHFVSDIPSPPAAYIAYPYVLLESARVVGRSAELDLLTDWIRGTDSGSEGVRIMIITAIGGMGKSALTWRWFSDMAANDAQRFVGRMWWSFYESDATCENFTVRALAYVRGVSSDAARALPIAERERQLLDVLNTHPFLLCLDGLERILLAYARPDAARMDEEALDFETDNTLRERPAEQPYAVQSTRVPERLRKTIDWRAGAFLRELSRVGASRILITTRLYPADLQGVTGFEAPACRAISLGGLEDDDGLALWSALGIRGDRDALLSIVRSVENYPLLIRILAGQIARFRPAPGDFDAWLAANPSLDPFRLPIVQRRTSVLQFALADLPPRARFVLMLLAAFRMPVAYTILSSLCVGGGSPFAEDSELHDALSELEGRGLIGWDRGPANRYDLHPVVRRVVWNDLTDPGREIVHEMIHAHLAESPAVADVHGTSVDELTPAVELYHTRIALGRQDEAFALFEADIREILVHRMNRFRVAIQMLEALFPNGIEHPPRLMDPERQRSATWTLAYAYDYAGEPWRTVNVWQRLGDGKRDDQMRALSNYANSLVSMGQLREAENVLERCVMNTPSGSRAYAVYSSHLGSVASLRGATDDADKHLNESMRAFGRFQQLEQPSDFSPLWHMFQHALRHSRLDSARALARWAISAAAVTNIVQIHLDALQMEGEALLACGDLDEAEASLTQALGIACDIGSESEIEVTAALAQLYARRGLFDEARSRLADVWEPIRRGQLRLAHADACATLAELEKAAGRTDEAIDASITGYRIAWCDGPPYSYFRAIERVRSVLADCGVAEPHPVAEEMT